MKEQSATSFELLYTYACCVLLYLHKPWRFNSCIFLFYSVRESDTISIFIMISLACLKSVAGCVMLFLGETGLWVWIGCVFLCKWMSLGFDVLDWQTVCNMVMWGSLWVKPLIRLLVLVLHRVWLPHWATCFIVSSIMSPWSISKSELDCGEIELTDAEVLWFMCGGGTYH